MPKTYEQKREDKVARFLASLTEESEFFGLFGKGHPTSFYKVYVRPTRTSRQWWKFESAAGPWHTNQDPMKYQAGLKVSGRATAVWGPLGRIADYAFSPEKPAIGRLFDRARALNGET